MQFKNDYRLLLLVVGGLFFPLFFQLNGGIFNSEKLIIDSGGVLSSLPLPVALPTCIVAVLLLWRNYRRAIVGAMFIAMMAASMLLSVVFAPDVVGIDMRKLLLATQFLLPAIGLLLGLMIRDEKGAVPRALMWVLLLLAPAQILASWIQHTLTLTHYLYIFSIYQHFQFVPVIFVVAYCFVMVHLWDDHKTVLKFLTFAMFIYAIASAAFLAIGAYSCFVVVFFLMKLRGLRAKRTALLGLGAGMAIAILVVGVYFIVAKSSTSLIDDNGQYTDKFQALAEGRLPANISGRLSDWRLYLDGISQTSGTQWFGHASPPPRAVKTSAHNWYLDFIYSFGLVSLFPMLAMIVYTGVLFHSRRGALSPQTVWLTVLVGFLVLIDNNFKVTLRQPYPGIFAFFLWGLLISRLRLSESPQGHSEGAIDGNA